MNDTQPSASADPAVPAKPAGKWSWRNLKGRFLIVSIALHVILALGATYFVITTIQARKPPNFKAGPPAAAPSRSDTVKVKAVQKQRSMSAPAPTKRITSTAISNIALPEMPDLPSPSSAAPTTMGGMGGTGIAFSGMGTPGGTGGGGGMNLFGLREAGSGLEGTFYDFKRLSKNRANDKIPPFPEIVKTFARGDIGPKGLKHYQSPAKLYSKVFLYPGIRDTEAGTAFQAPETAAGGWLAHYKGEFVSPVDGTYRLVGFGDNVLMVKIDSNIVLDASDKDFLGRKRDAPVGSVNMGAKQGAAIFLGNWFTLTRGQSKKIEIVIGDEGGIFCAGVFLQKRDVTYKATSTGVPDLPLFVIGTLDADQKAALGKFVPPTAFQGPVFTLGKGSSLLGR